MKTIRTSVVVGSGNVATALMSGLYSSGIEVIQIVARNLLTGRDLGQKYGCQWVSDIAKVDINVDAIFLCVQDDELPLVVAQIPRTSAIIVHTSGSTDIGLFKPYHSSYGVLYPMQTFSSQKIPEWSLVPIYVEGCNAEIGNILRDLALKLSPRVHFLSSQSRMQLHVAAVFACNFTNLLLTAAADLMKQNGLEFSELQQLVETTVQKAFDAAYPAQVQTGPAVRRDQKIIEMHMKSLVNNPDLKEIYAFMTEQIQKRNKQ